MVVHGNRGKCAQPCRLPYELLENSNPIDSGYLLSTRDLCGLNFIPALIKAGVTCLKIEGRMKSPEYVATVTRIYRKYIDLAYSNKKYVVDAEDRKDLMQAFNRGQSSSGHLDDEPNKKLVFKEKPNNMGLIIGTVQKYNSKKGHITLKLKEKIQVGDSISLQNETGTYTISELMENNKNLTQTKIGQTVTIGRMKGKINLGDKIYRLSSKELNTQAKESYRKENRKVGLNAVVTIKKKQPISIKITSDSDLEIYKDLLITTSLDFLPEDAKNKPLDKNTVITQISKTLSTPYEFKNIDVILDENTFLPKLSSLNELRRTALDAVQSYATAKIHRNLDKSNINNGIFDETECTLQKNNTQISVLLNLLNNSFDYSNLKNIDNIYIPLKYVVNKKYEHIIKKLTQKFDIYIYMPTVIKGNYKNLFFTNIKDAVLKYDIKGFVISNICNIQLLNNLFNELHQNLKIITNYTFNVFNKHTVLELKKSGITRFTLSPELDKQTIDSLCNHKYLQNEMIVYGKIPLMNMNYCLLGKSDKCYPSCTANCTSNNIYYLKDRLNMKFEVLPDNIQTVTTIFNSKTLSISCNDFDIDVARIDILHESIEEINNIVQTIKLGKRLEGKEFTNGNLNREI